MSYLDESSRIELVLGSNLERGLAGALGIPRGLSTSLNKGIDPVVVGGREDAQVVGSSDGGGVLRNGVTDGSRVAGDAAIVDIIANLSASKETIVTNNNVSIEGGTLEEIKEGTGVEEGLLEVKVELGTLGLGGRKELSEDLSLQAVGEGVVKLNLGVESVVGSPSLRQGQASGLVGVLGLNLRSLLTSENEALVEKFLTLPAIAPALWSDLPFTVNCTPLGALDLTSRLASTQKIYQYQVGLPPQRYLLEYVPEAVW